MHQRPLLSLDVVARAADRTAPSVGLAFTPWPPPTLPETTLPLLGTLELQIQHL